MKERPILFSAPMVNALLAGNKTQTRRVVKPQPPGNGLGPTFDSNDGFWSCWGWVSKCPYGQVGDQLWVKEKSKIGASGWHHVDGGWYSIDYAATNSGVMHKGEPPKHYPKFSHNKNLSIRWQPSIHMPRWASRIQLEITGIRVERLQDITQADAVAEGVELQSWEECNEAGTTPARQYQTLWETINGSGSWDANPWVWVVEFKVNKPALSA